MLFLSSLVKFKDRSLYQITILFATEPFVPTCLLSKQTSSKLFLAHGIYNTRKVCLPQVV